MDVHTAPYAEVETLQFGVLADVDHETLGVAVNSYELYDTRSMPVPGGLVDARMGTTDYHFACETCRLQKKDCPGHPGVMAVRYPMMGPLWVDEIRHWARIICLRCGTPVVDPKRVAGLKRDRRLKAAAQATAEGVLCPACRAPHPKVTKAEDDHFSIFAESAGSGPAERLAPDVLRRAFERVTPATVAAFGRPPGSHPERLLLRKIGVLPPTARPGVRMIGHGPGGGASSFHDSTNMYQYLAKKNGQLPEAIPSEINADLARRYQNFQEIYYVLVRGSAATTPVQSSQARRGLVVGGRTYRSIAAGLPQKEGRIRQNLLGSRVWRIARCTIAGNSLLRIDELGLSAYHARQSQVTERVCEFNLERLTGYVLNGRGRYPGCTTVYRRETGEVHRVEGIRGDFRLEVGDVVSRDLLAGEPVMFGRQPSLERSNLGVHKAVILDEAPPPDRPRASAHAGLSPFQMNVMACAGYGADFDGDQMSAIVPHSEMARAEARVLSNMSNWYISTKVGGVPINVNTQDSCVGSWALTRSGVWVDKLRAMRIFGGTRGELPDFSDSLPAYSGRELISRLFRQTPFSLRKGAKWFSEALAPHIAYDPAETEVVFRRGELERGVLDGATIKGSGVFQLIARTYGSQKALDLTFALQQMAIRYLGIRGFTVGTSDLVLSPEALAESKAVVARVLRDSALITEQLVRGEIVPPIGKTVHDHYEQLQIAALAVSDEILGPILRRDGGVDPDTNGLFQMIATGSKGTTPNLIHILAVIGQITINGSRLREQFAFRRTSPYFPRFATSAEAYGFVANSYIAGMTGPEFIASDMNGRFDLITKALSTATTGHQNRLSIMALQSDIVDNHRRVTAAGREVQPLYGCDGLDTRRIESVRFATAELSDAALRAGYRLDLAELARQGSVSGPAAALAEAQEVFDAEVETLRADRDAYRAHFLPLAVLDFGGSFSAFRQVPVDVARVLAETLAAGGPRPAPAAVADLVAMHRRVLAVAQALPYVFQNEIQERKKAPLRRQQVAAAALVGYLLRAELCGRALLGLVPAQLEYIIAVVRLRFAQALIDPGTAAGVLAAQAVSEFFTQYMLDSHHRSVGQGTNKAGLIRPSEILGAKPIAQERSPEMLLRLVPEAAGDEAQARLVASQLEFLTFVRFVAIAQVVVEPFGAPRYPLFAADREWIAEFGRHHPLLAPPSDLTNWCSRFELDRQMLILKSMSLETIAERLRAAYSRVAHVVHTPENVSRIVIRVYYRDALFRREAGGRQAQKTVMKLHEEILGTAIRGIPGILSAKAVTLRESRVAADGGIETASAYGVHTVGTNLYRAILHRSVDPLRAVSSSIGDTAKTFGIVAARYAIQREIRRLMGDKASNARHLTLYADEMTRTGRVTSLEKSGVAIRGADDVFLRMALASPVQVVREAALSGRTSKVQGVSAPLMLGALPTIGSLYNDVIVDVDFVRENTRSVDDILDAL